jgi:hypothetical protein
MQTPLLGVARAQLQLRLRPFREQVLRQRQAGRHRH